MISPLLPFTGGLRGQAAEIVSILAYHAPAPFGLFCDPFFGGGSVSYEAKRRGFGMVERSRQALLFPGQCPDRER